MRYLAIVPILAATTLACGDENAPAPIPSPSYVTSLATGERTGELSIWSYPRRPGQTLRRG
jgi:hypothetical protein